MTDNSVAYGKDHSLMTFDFKLAKDDFFSDELQRMMTIRKEATFYDVSTEVTTQAMEVAKAWNFVLPSAVVPPTAKGYMRISLDDGVGLVERGIPRVNGMLWDRGTVYLIHDQGTKDHVLLAPFKATINMTDEEFKTKWANRYYKDANIEDAMALPAFRRIGAELISHNASPGSVLAFRAPVEELLAIAYVVFDMLAEIKATTVERKSERFAFASKHQTAFQTVRVVKVSLGKCRAKYLRQHHEKTGRTNAWHEVRSHFRHRRVTKPDCQHRWVHRYAEDDGKHYKCETCGEIKTRVEYPNGAGDKTKGIVKHVYEIVK